MQGNKIHQMRENRGLTMDELAEAANTTSSQISKLEKGKRKLSLDWMARLAKALNCHPAELINWDIPINIDPKNNRDPVLASIIETIIDMSLTDQEMADYREELIDAAYKIAQRHLKGGINALNPAFMMDLQREIYLIMKKHDHS